VYVDDTHTIAGGTDARVLARLVAEAPPAVRFVVATRDDRLLRTADVPGPVQHIGYRDLRFDPADVARLFATVYRGELSDDAAEALCERVEGLPVALRMLHLDTTLLRPAERTAAFTDPLTGSERLREFLTGDVLGALPEPLRDFMVDVSPFGVLDPALCDAHLGRSDSAGVLAELTARNALTFRAGTETYRFHVLLQRLLEALLVTRRGTHLARQAHHGAATHLAGAGHWAEAYRGYARAGDWAAAARVVHRLGVGEHGPRAAASVPAVLFDDPWVALAEARRLRGDGRFAEACDRYLAAADRLPDRRLRWQCSQERSAIAPWTAGRAGEAGPHDDVSWHVAAAVRGQPARLVAQAVPVDSPEWTLGKAVAAMLDGRARLSIELAAPLVAPPAGDGGTFVSLAARLLVATVTAQLHGQGTATVFADLAADAEAAGWLWVARIARAATALLDVGACADAAAILSHCEENGDEWGALIAAYLLTIGLLRAGRPVLPDVVAVAVARARRLGALVPEAWLRIVLVDDLTRRDQPGAATERAELDRLWGAEVLGPVRHERAGALAALTAPPEPAQLVLAPKVVEAPAPVAVRCLGAFEFAVAGVPVDLDGLRAQARCVLRVLSMQYGQPMHEERLVATLWPDAPLKRAKHRLQVAISSLRALLRPYAGAAGGIVRHGSAYVLALPPGSTVDVVEFDAAVRRWRAGRHVNDPARVRALGADVLDRYLGELLVEEGAAEWVLTRRESIRGEAAGVAVALATLELARGDVAAAIEVCERALAIDELDHRLWTLLAKARHRAGDPAAAVRAREAYRSLVAEA
jgi:DNA-binding SARP family transcriptional activator